MDEKEKEIKKVEDDEVLDPDDFDDEEEEDEGDVEKTTSDEADSKTQEDEEKEKNAKAAERRRKREKAQKEREAREAKIREEATLEAKLGILKTNPYTDEPIEDEEDLKIYEIQKELDDQGLDPINDLPKRLAQKARIAAKEMAEKQEKEQKEKQDIEERIKKDISELQKKYPDVDLGSLSKDDLYKECIKGRAGRWTQVEIYEYYLARKSEQERKAQEEKANKIAEEGAKKISNPPSSTAKGNSPQKTVEEMSREEFEAYFKDKYNA